MRMRGEAAFCGQCTSDAAANYPSSERRDRCEPVAALRCTLAGSTSTCHRLYFFGCMPSVLPAASRRGSSTPPKLFAPGLNARLGPIPCLRFRFRVPAQAKQALRLCLRAKAAILRHLFAYASIDCYYHHRSRDVTCRRGTSAPDSSANPSRYPLLVAACRRERARSPPACRSELASPYYARRRPRA